jgi:hypothetical protein
MISRNDTALHRNTHNRQHPIAKGAAMARHVIKASVRPTIALGLLLDEIERCGCDVNPVVRLRAKVAYEGAMPYVLDDTGDKWK